MVAINLHMVVEMGRLAVDDGDTTNQGPRRKRFQKSLFFFFFEKHSGNQTVGDTFRFCFQYGPDCSFVSFQNRHPTTFSFFSLSKRPRSRKQQQCLLQQIVVSHLVSVLFFSFSNVSHNVYEFLLLLLLLSA